MVQPRSCAAEQLCSRVAVQPSSCVAVQPCSRVAVQPCRPQPLPLAGPLGRKESWAFMCVLMALHNRSPVAQWPEVGPRGVQRGGRSSLSIRPVRVRAVVRERLVYNFLRHHPVGIYFFFCRKISEVRCTRPSVL